MTTEAPAAPTSLSNTEALLASDFAATLKEHWKAGYQAMYVQGDEEHRIEATIKAFTDSQNAKLVYWDTAQGFTGDNDTLNKNNSATNANKALEAIADRGTFNHPTAIVMRDLDDYFKDNGVRRRLRNLCEGNKLVDDRRRTPIIVVSPSLEVHPKLKTELTVLDFALPNETDLARVVEFIRSTIENTNKDKTRSQLDDELRDQLCRTLLGLTSTEAENCLSRCVVRHKAFVPEMINTIKEEKAKIVKKSGTLTYIPEDDVATRDQIGGMDNLLDWLDVRKLAYSRAARELNIDPPKGIALIGPPGTGKSMVGEGICKLMGLPGYILDVGAVFGSLVGESEQRMRDAIRQIEAQRGCVLLVDEVDKAFGGAVSGSGDSGVSRRVFGTFLSWLAKNNSNTFVVVTMNRTAGLPPEFLRAGRFDAMFYAGLPGPEARRAIFDIHFNKRGVDPESLDLKADDWATLIEKTDKYVGSEIEEIVRSSRYAAFAARQEGTPTFEELVAACDAVIPTSTTSAEDIKLIEEFCENRTIPVAKPSITGTRKGRGRGKRSVDVS